MNIDLGQTLPKDSNGINCLGKLDVYDELTHDQLMLSFEDDTYNQGFDLTIRFKKQP